MRKIGWVLPLLTFATIVWLNAIESRLGGIAGIAFCGGENAFSQFRGWPFRAFAKANEEGARLIEASVVQGDTRLNREVFDGAFPHLAWNPFCVEMNLLIACLLLGISFLLAIVINRSYDRKSRSKGSCQQIAAADADRPRR